MIRDLRQWLSIIKHTWILGHIPALNFADAFFEEP